MWSKIKSVISQAWGRTTTVVLGVLAAAVPAFQLINPALLPQQAQLAIALAGVAIAVLRVVAPPPPSVTVGLNDALDVDHSTGVVTITKPVGTTFDLTAKPAGLAS